VREKTAAKLSDLDTGFRPEISYPDIIWYTYIFIYLSIYLFNPLNAKLNTISHVLALLGAHPILSVSRIRVDTRWQQYSSHLHTNSTHVDTRWQKYSTHLYTNSTQVDTRWQQYSSHLHTNSTQVDTRWQQHSSHLHTNSTRVDPLVAAVQLTFTHKQYTGWHPVAAAQYTFTHKQYTEYTEQNVHNSYKIEILRQALFLL
jgi:hypothetical protein